MGFKLTASPTAQNTLVDNRESVTIVACDEGNIFVFVSFVPVTLRTGWQQRAPGTMDDPRGLADIRMDEKRSLWRSHLDKQYLDLLDRFDPATVVRCVTVD